MDDERKTEGKSKIKLIVGQAPFKSLNNHEYILKSSSIGLNSYPGSTVAFFLNQDSLDKKRTKAATRRLFKLLFGDSCEKKYEEYSKSVRDFVSELQNKNYYFVNTFEDVELEKPNKKIIQFIQENSGNIDILAIGDVAYNSLCLLPQDIFRAPHLSARGPKYVSYWKKGSSCEKCTNYNDLVKKFRL